MYKFVTRMSLLLVPITIIILISIGLYCYNNDYDFNYKMLSLAQRGYGFPISSESVLICYKSKLYQVKLHEKFSLESVVLVNPKECNYHDYEIK